MDGSGGLTPATVHIPVYDRIGVGYGRLRRPDPQIAAAIERALGDAATVVNVGAGTGSYEPADRAVVAVEPSATMLAQRPPGAAPAVRGVAEHLPFRDSTFDAALAVMTVHHWRDWRAGLRELRRVSRRQVILTFDWAVHDAQWVIADHVPAIAGLATGAAVGALGGRVEVVPCPADCTDGFLVAYWNRPEAYLEHEVRAATSGFSLTDPAAVEAGMVRLAAELASGAWDERYGHLRAQEELDVGIRLVVAET